MAKLTRKRLVTKAKRAETKAKPPNRYQSLILGVFTDHHQDNEPEFEFTREELEKHAKKLQMKLPKNLGDILYSFRYRAPLPKEILEKAPAGKSWIIRPAGKGKYRFALVTVSNIKPSEMMATTKVPDATPGIIDKYALNDEQALLAKVRYNRLVDVFTGVTCYSLQNHLRTTVTDIGQVETDEVYVGLDKKGAHYVFPVQAKGKTDRLNVVQIEQDVAVCRQKYPNLVCRPIGAQFLKDRIVLFEFEISDEGLVTILTERHYSLVPQDQVTAEDLAKYREREHGE